MKNNDTIKALLFDLGGVILDIDFNLAFKSWSKHTDSSAEKIRSKFKFDRYYEAHEKGEIEFEEYFFSLRKTLGINITDQEFKDGWNSIFIDEILGISTLLVDIKKKIPIYIFSNTNHLHKSYWLNKFQPVLSNFEKIFTSSDIGKRKPELEAFQIVTDLIGIESPQIVFFDDLLENVNGAKRAGLKTVHVQTILDTEKGIKQFTNLN